MSAQSVEVKSDPANNPVDTLAKRRQLVANLRASGQSQRAFSVAHGLNPRSLSRWVQAEQEGSGQGFSRLGSVNHPSLSMTLRLPNGYQVSLPLGIELGYVAKLVSLLEK